MTLEKWTDIVAAMTPKQREAMGYAMLAREEDVSADMMAAGASPSRGSLTYALELGPKESERMLQSLSQSAR